MPPFLWIVIPVAVVAFLVITAILLSFAWRVVVDTNKVHIVQSRKKTTSYGVGAEHGNVYYRVPSFIPVWGVTTIELPVSNFDLSLNSYKAYDKDRVPFELDITAFMRIADTNTAAARVSSFTDLKTQLQSVVQGAVRKILSSYDINTVMGDRSTFGQQFTDEVKAELANWGVEPVKNLELMDIRDSDGSKVIANIMAKKTSFIEMESRVEVAKNQQAAKEAEIAAGQAVLIREQEAQQQVGERTAQQERATGIAKEKSRQDIQQEAAITKEREMEVLSVETQRNAEITKKAQVVLAEQQRDTDVIKAEAQKKTTVLISEGNLQEAKLTAEGIKAKGEAEAAAKQAMETAPVQAQILLAQEIGENQGYQKYLIDLREVEASQVVGVAQAAALQKAEIKIIANNDTASKGLNSVGELFSSTGGTKLGAMVEGFAQTEEGRKLIDKFIGKGGAA
jgi:flotillin